MFYKSKEINKMIFLDFDGVLFDTVREAYAVAVISSGRYNSIDEIVYLEQVAAMSDTYKEKGNKK